MDKALFKFSTEIRVRNYEVDWQGIVHNANYLLYFEVGRLEYLKHIGVKIDMNTIQGDSMVVLVRNEIDYKKSALFDDVLKIYTRLSYIKNTSFAFEGIIENAKTGDLISENVAYHVWLDHATNKPKRVSDGFRKLVKAYEGGNVEMKE